MNGHVYKKKEVVIGGTLSAAAYALKNDAALIFIKPKKYFAFEQVKNEIFHFRKGTSKNEVLRSLIFKISLSGNLLVSDKATGIRVIQEKNLLKVFIENSRIIKISYDKLKIFDNEGVTGLNFDTNVEVSEYKVYDWFIARSGACHEYEELVDNSSVLAKKVYFYKSSRPFRKDRVLKDLVSESILKKEQLNNFEFSDTMVRIKTSKMMKEKGIMGKRNGKDTKNPSIYRYYAIKLELEKREFFAVERPTTKKKGNVVFDNRDLE
jgi:hypothetical protein